MSIDHDSELVYTCAVIIFILRNTNTDASISRSSLIYSYYIGGYVHVQYMCSTCA